MNKMIPYLLNALLTLLWDILANIGVSSHISNSENATSLQENNHYFRIAINQVTLPKNVFSILHQKRLVVILHFWFINFYESYQFPAGIYLLKVNYRYSRTRCEICSKLTIKTPERCNSRRHCRLGYF